MQYELYWHCIALYLVFWCVCRRLLRINQRTCSPRQPPRWFAASPSSLVITTPRLHWTNTEAIRSSLWRMSSQVSHLRLLFCLLDQVYSTVCCCCISLTAFGGPCGHNQLSLVEASLAWRGSSWHIWQPLVAAALFCLCLYISTITFAARLRLSQVNISHRSELCKNSMTSLLMEHVSLYYIYLQSVSNDLLLSL